MKLHADRGPVLDGALDRLDHAVRGAGGHLEAHRHVVDRHVVHAVHADLAVAVDPLHRGTRLDEQGMPVGQVGRILVGDRLRQVFGDVEEQRAPHGDVDELHAAADREDRHVAGADVLGEHPVEVFATGVHRADGRVGHVAVAAGIEVGAAHHHHAVEQVEEADHIVLVGQGRQDHGNATRGRDAVVVAGGDEREGRVLLAGRTVVGVDADEGLGCHG